MLAISSSPSTFPSFLWPLDHQDSTQQFYHHPSKETENTTVSSIPDYVSCPQSPSFASTADPNMVKKLNHNATERDRRKMINGLYSSLRSLLPASDQMKKLSIPSTVSQVLKYIPELQQQVERLSERKEKLISKLYNQNQNNNKNTKQATNNNNLPLISATKLTETQLVIQISTFINIDNGVQTCPLSEILLLLEEEGLSLINSSSFHSFAGRVFYTLHLQVEETYRLECEALSDKLVSLYENREVLFPLY